MDKLLNHTPLAPRSTVMKSAFVGVEERATIPCILKCHDIAHLGDVGSDLVFDCLVSKFSFVM